MGDTGPARTSAPLGIVAIAGIVLGVAAVGYLVTTFLFAFSGGQYRMVAVVNLGAVAVISLCGVGAAGVWVGGVAAETVKRGGGATRGGGGGGPLSQRVESCSRRARSGGSAPA